MSTGEDEPSPVLNGRLRPRKSASTSLSPQNLPIRKSEGKLAQDRPKRTSASSKASPVQQNDLAAKSDTSPTPQFLCPYCDRTFATRQTASKHARRIHLSTSKQDNFIKCLHCNHSDAESHAIIKHMVDSHPNQYFACLDCHTRFYSTTELAEHKLNVCEKQKPPYRNKLRQKSSAATKKNTKRLSADEQSDSLSASNENTQYADERVFNGIVISCELKPSDVRDETDIEDKITTNLILPPSKTLANATMEKNAVIVLDDLQWNKRIPPNFSFHNTDADQILSRLGVVHRSPRVGESKKDLIRMMDEPNELFEKCFDTSFYSKVAKNVQDNLTKYLDGSFNYNPDKDNTVKTRKTKMSVVINTAEGFPILLAYEQFSRNLFDGFIPRTMAPKHKWKWDTTDNDKNAVMLLDQTKRDSHVNNCIITLVSSLDIWTQLRMRGKFEEIFKTTPTAKKTVKQNILSMELKEILESRDIPTTSSQVVPFRETPVVVREGSELPTYLGLSPRTTNCALEPAVLSGEWVRPRCYVCCACGEQARDSRSLSAHITAQHPSAQVQHYEIVGETLLSADILKHLYVPPSQMSNRTRPPRGFRDCTKCKKSITLEDLHQHMLDCAGDTPTVRRKCRYRPFGVRRRRPRLPDNTIRKKMRKDIRSRHRQKGHLRPKIRTEVGDAETIRKMIADLPAKRNRITPSNVLRPRRNIIKVKKTVKLRVSEDTKSNKPCVAKNLVSVSKTDESKKQNDSDNSVDEDDQPLKLSAKRASTRSGAKNAASSRITINKRKIKKQLKKTDSDMEPFHPDYYKRPPDQIIPHNMFYPNMLPPNMYPLNQQINLANNPYYYNQPRSHLAVEQPHPIVPALEHATMAQRKRWALKRDHDRFVEEKAQQQRALKQTQRQLARDQVIYYQRTRQQEQQNKPEKKQLDCKETPKMRVQRNLRAKELDKQNALAKEQAQYYQPPKEHESSANKRENQLAEEEAENSALVKKHALQVQLDKEYADHMQQPHDRAKCMKLAEQAEYMYRAAEYAKHIQLTEKQSAHFQLPPEQAHNIQLAKEFAQHIEVTEEQPKHIQLPQDQPQYTPLAKEYVRHVQMTEKQSEHIQQSHEKPQYTQPAKEYGKDNQLAEKLSDHGQLPQEKAQKIKLAKEQAHNIQLAKEYAQHIQLAKEQAHNILLANEYAQHSQLIEKQSEHFQLPKDQERKIQLAKEYVQHIELTEKQPECIELPQEQPQCTHLTNEYVQNTQLTEKQSELVQPPREQAQNMQLTKEYEKYNQLVKEGGQHMLTEEQIHEKIDVRGAGPYDMRRHSNRDECDMQNGKNRPAERDEGNKNYNMTPASNMPLKHSIASLTTETETHDASVPYKHPDGLPQNTNVTIKHTPEDNRQEFENEDIPEKLHKPPLPFYPVDLQEDDEQPILLNLSRKPDDTMSKDSFKSVEISEELMEIKNESDKLKLNKTRKGLNDCIAMLLTKKGLSNCSEDENLESPAIDTGSDPVELEPSVTDGNISEKNNYLLPGSVTDNSINLTPAQVFSRSVLPENYQCKSYPVTDIQCDSTSALTPPDTSADRELISQSSMQNEDKREFSRTRSSSETEYKTVCQMAPPSWTDQKKTNEANPCEIIQNMRHNSYDGEPIHVEAERFLKIRQSETVNSLNQIHNESVNKIMGCTDRDLQERYNKHFTLEMFNQQSKVHLGKEGEACVPHKFGNTKIPTPQETLSPTSRRTRRKPAKNDSTSVKSQPSFNYRRSPLHKTNADKQTVNFGMGVEDQNKHLVSARYLPPSSSVDTIPLKSPPAPRVLRESYKRSIDISDTVANAVANNEDGSQNKVSKKSAETHADKTEDLRRHSAEFTLAQAKIAAYENMMMQAYRDRWNKNLLNVSPSSGGPSQWHKMISEDLLKRFHGIHVPCETSNNELLSRYSSNLMFGSSNQDTIGILYVNPEGKRSDLLNTTKTNEATFNNLLENEQYRLNPRLKNAQTERSNNYSGSTEGMTKDDERIDVKNTNQEYRTNIKTSNVLDNNLHRHGIRRSSEECFTRSTSYQHNFVDTGYEENRNSDDNSLQHAHHNMVSFARPAVPYSDNTYRAQMPPTQQKVNNAEETPLDLSCDPNTREQKSYDLGKKSLDIFKKPCDIPLKNVKEVEPVMKTMYRHFTEQLQNIPKNPHFAYKIAEYESNNDLVHLPATNAPLGETGINQMRNETNVSKNHLDHGLATLNAAITHYTGSKVLENTLYNSSIINISNNAMEAIRKQQECGNNSTSEQLLSPPDYNLHTLRQSQCCNSMVSRQESMQDKTFCENKKITRVSSTLISPIVPERRSSWIDGDSLDPVVGNVDPHANLIMDDHMASVNITTDNFNAISCQEYQTTEAVSVEARAHSQMYNQDILLENDVSMDQDPDTARKIAMLPKELVEILGTMPKDHRNQLLNILPQYVSTAASIERKEMENISSATIVHTTSDTSQIENKQSHLNKLIINTAISPSRIIPKKRHSPSQISVKNFNEAQQILPGLHPSHIIMPTLSQLPPTVYDDKLMSKVKYTQNPLKNNDSGSSAKDPFTETMSQKILDKDSDDTEINVVDWNESENTNKNVEVSKSAGHGIFMSVPQQDLIPRPITKSKNSNEQTASLRAVRIKTTSARKSLCDDNNVSTNSITYQYPTNLSTDQKYTNTEQIVNSTDRQHYSYKNVTDWTIDKSKMNSEIQMDNNMLIRPILNKNSTEDNNVLNASKSIELPVTCETGGGKKDKTCLLINPAMVSQNEHNIPHDTQGDANQSSNIVTLDRSSKALQGINMDHAHFLGSIKSTTFSGGGNHRDAVILQQSKRDVFLKNKEINVVSGTNTELSVKDISGNDFTTESKYGSEMETTEKKCQIITEEPVYRSSKVNEVKETLSPDFVQDKVQLNSNSAISHGEPIANLLSSENIIVDNTISCNKSLSEKLSPKDENLNEDDSDDEVSLAVLKQKHSSQTTFPKQSKYSAELDKEEKCQPKLARKYRKKKSPESTKTVQNDKLFGDYVNNINESSENELSLNDTEVKTDHNEIIIKSISVNTTDLDKGEIEKHFESDVNKENDVTENNHNESQLDRAIDKTIDDESKDAPNINMNLNLIPENGVVVKDSTVTETCNELEIKEKCVTVKDSPSKIKEDIKSHKCINDKNVDNKGTTECENDSDTCSVTELKLLTSDTVETPELNITKSEQEDAILKLSEVSTKLTTYPKSQDNVVGDLQLNAEIPELTIVPLRRSRRGKSFYVDSNCLEASGHAEGVEDIDQRTPLTMKHLILSRVEKDKKRINEHNVFEKNCDAEDVNPQVTDNSCTKKRKIIRKMSPKSKRKSKKLKSRNIYENDEDTSDGSIMPSASESNSSILPQITSTENKSEDIESCKGDVKNDVISENTEDLLINCKEKINDESGLSTPNLQKANVAEKHKLNFSKITDLDVCKSKKSKYKSKDNVSSDFESDDEIELSKTKHKIATEIHKILDKDESTNSAINSPTNVLDKEDSDDKPLKICSGAAAEPSIETNKAGESHTTCYNRPISNRRHRSCSATFKDHANYDPYNIDFEDMLEPMRPISKKKLKNVYNDRNHDQVNTKSDNLKVMDANGLPSNLYKHAANTINLNNESDSDSSKSDVPLQKYVLEKTLETELKNKIKNTRKNSMEHTEKKDEKGCKPKNDSLQQNFDHPSKSGHNEDNTSNSELNQIKISRSGKGKKSTKRVKKYNSNEVQDESSNINHNLNMNKKVSTKQTTPKIKSKKKKSSHTLATPNIDNPVSVSKEDDLQLRSDKFMENFGFYSERIPRKSNLLASKKIAETYSMISNESDDNYFRHKEKPTKKPTPNEKKRSEIGSDVNASQDSRKDETNVNVQSIESKIDDKATTSKEPDVMPIDDGDVDSQTAKNILESEEIRNLENALFSGFKKAADANAATNCYLNFPPSNSLPSVRQDVDPSVSTIQVEEDNPKNYEQPESTKKQSKSKPNKQAGVKDKMYPDIEEIDMFEDKFDKIKRKRRSQAVAAKQIQSVIEHSTSVKSRKQTERKRTPKNTKKNYQSTQVPTKGALKGFDGIKISIPTQDLNMPLNVSPPRQQKKRRKAASKRRKERNNSATSSSEFDDKDKSLSERDIYEFKDNEDAESFELRPSTVMDRFRSMHVKYKSKHKERDRGKGDVEKDKHRERPKEKEKKTDTKEIELINDEKRKAKKREETEFEKKHKKHNMREERRHTEKKGQKESSYLVTKLDIKDKREKSEENVKYTSKPEKGPDINESTRNDKSLSETTCNRNIDLTDEADSAKAGTSGFVPDRIDESDYESELSSPEGEFIFYMSNDINCICPSDNDSDDSDVERGCGRPNCIYKNRNADKKTAIGNIFKNNAVRCEKTPDAIKEPDAPRPDLDQLFDSLFETNNSELSRNQKKDITDNIEDPLAPWPSRPVDHAENIRKAKPSASHHNPHMSSKQEHNSIIFNKDNTSNFTEGSSITAAQDLMLLSKSLVTIKNKPDEKSCATKRNETSSITLNVHNMSDCKSTQIFTADKPREKLGLSLGAKVFVADTIADKTVAKNETNEKVMTNSEVMTVKEVTAAQPTKYKSEDKYETDKPASLKRRHKRHTTPPPANKTEDEHKSDISDTEFCDESPATKYLKSLPTEEAAKMNVYIMVSAQGTQTEKSDWNNSSNSEDLYRSKTTNKIDKQGIPTSRIRLQKLNIFEINQKTKTSKGIQTDKSFSGKSYDIGDETEDDNEISEDGDRRVKEPKSSSHNNNASIGELKEGSEITPPGNVNSFVTPTPKPTGDKHSPRKSDEGISTSHDYSAEAFEQSSFDDAGVARQRARRKCTVGKQNVLAEHWSSESEFDGIPPRPTSADSVVASVSRKKKSKKNHHSGGKRGSRHSSKNESKSMRERGAIGGLSDDSDACAGPSRAPHGPKIRARPAHHYWSSDGEDAPDPQPQHGWIVGDSHKKLVTMLAHAKGRKRNNGDKRQLLD